MNDYEKALAYLQLIESCGKAEAGMIAAAIMGSFHENVLHWAEWMVRNNPEFIS